MSDESPPSAAGGGTAHQVLAEAGRVLALGLDEEARLRAVSRLLVPALADWCAIDVLDARGTLRRAALTHRNPEAEAMIRDIGRRYPPTKDAEHPLSRVLRTGKPDIVAEGSPSWIDARARDAEHREMLVALRFHSRLTVPLLADSHVLGAISLVASTSGRRYTERDCPLAEALASMCALAISNARLLSQATRSRARHEVLVRTMRRWRAAEQVDELLRDLLRDARDLVGGMQAAIQPWDEHRQMLVGG
ncbi:MAG: GAF domain-containing protein, partial [Chloroflexi bacterium]|nr:GAF domain-containing protein [Chloroflexota bacterium]